MEKRRFLKWKRFIEILAVVVLLFILKSEVAEAVDSCGGSHDGESGEAWHNYNPGYNTETFVNVIEQNNCVQYVEKRTDIGWNLDAKSKDDPDNSKLTNQLLEGGGIGANYYKTADFGTSGIEYECKCDECLEKEEQRKTDGKITDWKYIGPTILLMPTSSPNDVWNYVKGDNEETAIFLNINDTVDVDEDSTEIGEKMQSVINYYKSGVIGNTGGFYPNSKRLRELKVEIDKKELHPGETFTVYVKGLKGDKATDISKILKDFKLENCISKGDWKEAKKKGDGWFKHEFEVNQGSGLKENKVRITTSYDYKNYYAIEYRFNFCYSTHTGEIRENGSIQLVDPFEGSQDVHRDIAIEIPLSCNVKINQYISKIDGVSNPDYIEKTGSDWQLKNSAESRIDWGEDNADCWVGNDSIIGESKKTRPVATENGSQLEYTVIVRNKTNRQVNSWKNNGNSYKQNVGPIYLRVRDYLPKVFKNQDVTIAYKLEKEREGNRRKWLG